MSYLINNNGKQSGPFTEEQAKDVLKLGLPDALYSPDNGQSWLPLADFGQPPAPVIDPTPEELSQRQGAPPAPSSLRPRQLRRCPLFADMDDEQVLQFASLMERFSIPAFKPIVKLGTPSNSLFILLDGQARISLPLDGKEEMLKMIGPGDFIGEMAMWDEGGRSADVVATQPCTILRLTKQDFLMLLQEKPGIAALFLLAMNRFLSRRIRDNNERYLKAKNFAHAITGNLHGIISDS
ncbi:MAG: cyclic nucleotide-binding domain-containing protein [Opitutales bacterium]